MNSDFTFKSFRLPAMIAAALSFFACDKIGTDSPDSGFTLICPVESGMSGLYLLNEGSQGANNSTLDFVDLEKGKYYSNYFARQNPGMPLALGDTGNDLILADGYLVIVLNGSNIVEIADAATAGHIAQVTVPQGRNVIREGDFLYVTSWADDGTLYRISMSDWQISGKVQVGYEPEGLHCHDGKIYVLNSGGGHYETGGYEQTISVVDMDSFTVDRTIETGHFNLADILCMGNTEYVNSLGNYGDDSGAVFSFDRETGAVSVIVNHSIANWCLYDGTVYTQSTAYDASWNPVVSYGKIENGTFSDGAWFDTDAVKISNCYGLSANPSNGDFVITDAGDYVTPGSVYYFTSDGSPVWSATAGVCPTKIVWIE